MEKRLKMKKIMINTLVNQDDIIFTSFWHKGGLAYYFVHNYIYMRIFHMNRKIDCLLFDNVFNMLCTGKVG